MATLLLAPPSYSAEHPNCTESNRFPEIPPGEDFSDRYDHWCDTDEIGTIEFHASFLPEDSPVPDLYGTMDENRIKEQFKSTEHDNYSEYGNFIFGALHHCRGESLTDAVNEGHIAGFYLHGVRDSAAGTREITAGFAHSRDVASLGGSCGQKRSVNRQISDDSNEDADDYSEDQEENNDSGEDYEYEWEWEEEDDDDDLPEGRIEYEHGWKDEEEEEEEPRPEEE